MPVKGFTVVTIKDQTDAKLARYARKVKKSKPEALDYLLDTVQ